MFDTPQNIADINSIVNTCVAREIPSLVIDQNIGWLSRMRRDIDFTINQLEHLKKSRDHQRNHRNLMNDLADELIDDNGHLDDNVRIQIIIQRIGCNKKRAWEILELIKSKYARKKRDERNKIIALKHKSGLSITKLAHEYDLSRQQIYNIISSVQA